MAKHADPVIAAYRRVAILKSIIAAERKRAVSKPYDDRNIDLGLIEPDQPSRDVIKAIEASFDRIQILLDHAALMHMAAAFEQEAKARLDTVAGATRAAIQQSRGRNGAWASKLVRGADSYDSLKALGDVIEMTSRDRNSFGAVKAARNQFGHGVPDTYPVISAEDARDLLVEALARIK